MLWNILKHYLLSRYLLLSYFFNWRASKAKQLINVLITWHIYDQFSNILKRFLSKDDHALVHKAKDLKLVDIAVEKRN